jgi:putative endonuclease
MKQFAVYFMNNWTNEILYVGVTSDLLKRIWQHKNKFFKGFTEKYNLTKLVYFEMHETAETAILREKQIKRWNRKKKDFLVNELNPDWQDLYDNLTGANPLASLRFARDDNNG